MQQALPSICIWVKNNAAEMAAFYASVFANTTIISTNTFATKINIQGLPVVFLNANNSPVFSDTYSLIIECQTQTEIDAYWEKLTKHGGEEMACGWLQDKYGIRWQIIPAIVGSIMQNEKQAALIMPIFSKMKKIVIADLQAAIQNV